MFKKLFLILVSIFLSLFIFEYFLKIINFQKEGISWNWTNGSAYHRDQSKIYSLKKTFRVHNSCDAQSKEDLKTVLMIGDSFTFGVGVDSKEAYPFQVEKILKELHGWNIVVYNAGVSGYGLDQEYLHLVDLLDEIDPDIVVWNLNVNDFSDTNFFCLFVPSGQEYKRVSSWRNLLMWRNFFLSGVPISIQNTRIFSLVVNNLFSFSNNYENIKEPRWTFGCSSSDTFEVVRTQVNKKFEFFLSKLKSHGTEANFLFVLVPDRWTYDMGTNNLFVQPWESAVKRYGFPYFNSSLGMMYVRKNIDNKEDLDFSSMYVGDDGYHLNDFGNKVFAFLVANFIIDNDML